MRNCSPALALCLVAAAVVSGCANVEFIRNEEAPKVAPLPGSLDVQLAESVNDVAQPAVVIGVLKLPAAENSLSQAAAEKRFLAHAARYGCDAIVEVDAHSIQVEKTQRKRTLGKGGKVQIENSKETVVQTQWTARCVRTASAEKRERETIARAGGRMSRSTARRLSGSTDKRSAATNGEAGGTPDDKAPDGKAPDGKAQDDKAREMSAEDRAVARYRSGTTDPDGGKPSPQDDAKRAAARERAVEAARAKARASAGAEKVPADEKTPAKDSAAAKPGPVPVVRPDVKPLDDAAAKRALQRQAARDKARRDAEAKAAAVARSDEKKLAAEKRALAAKDRKLAADQARQDAAARNREAAVERARAAAEAKARKAESAEKKREEAAARKAERAEAKRVAAEERKQKEAAAAQARAEEKQRKAEAKAKAAEDKRLAADAAKQKAIDDAKAAADAEKQRIAAEVAANAAAILKAYDDAIAAKDPVALANVMHANPGHVKFERAQVVLTAAALARPDQWFTAHAVTKGRGGFAHPWKLTNPSNAPVVVRFEVAAMAHHRPLAAAKSSVDKLIESAASKTPGRLLDVIVVTRELAIDRKAANETVPLPTIAAVWSALPRSAMTDVYLQQIDEDVAAKGAETSKIRGSVRAGKRPSKDEYQPAKVSLKNGTGRDVTVNYDAGTGRTERLILKRNGSLSLTLMIPPGNEAGFKVISVLPKLRSLEWLTGQWTLGSAQLVFVPVDRDQVAAFAIVAGVAGADGVEPVGPLPTTTVIPWKTHVAGSAVSAKAKIPSAFARSVFFDLQPCPDGGCDAVITVPLQWQDKYDEKGARALRIKMTIGSRDGTAKFTSQY